VVRSPNKESSLTVNRPQGSPVKAQLAHWPVPKEREKKRAGSIAGAQKKVTRVSAETCRVISDLSVSSR